MPINSLFIAPFMSGEAHECLEEAAPPKVGIAKIQDPTTSLSAPFLQGGTIAYTEEQFEALAGKVAARTETKLSGEPETPGDQALDELCWEAFLQTGIWLPDTSGRHDSLSRSGHAASKCELGASDSTHRADSVRTRNRSRRQKAIEALRKMVEHDPVTLELREAEKKAEDHLLSEETINGSASPRAEQLRERCLELGSLAEDFHLTHLSSIAESIEKCGQTLAHACQSYWCPHCRKRFGARLLEDTQAQLRGRYGPDLEVARDQLLFVTILNEIVLPDPDQIDVGGDFSASTIRRDHRDIRRYLDRWKADNLRVVSSIVARHKLSLTLVIDWLALDKRDCRFYSRENMIADALRLFELNEQISVAKEQFKGRNRVRPDLEAESFVSSRDKDRTWAYLYQLKGAEPFERREIYPLARALQCVFREFPGITKTRFKERLKFKSSIEKVMKRERSKLYRLGRELPRISLIGQFELELIDLHHAVGGLHQHARKSSTLRVLASQERQPGNRARSRVSSARQSANDEKRRLLDKARMKIASNQELSAQEFPGLKYAVLLHMHVLVDLNGVERADFERWLTGKKVGCRRFAGQWKLPLQVMTKSLFQDKTIDKSLSDISRYPFKDVVSFNYDNCAPKREDGSAAEDNTNSFPDEGLAVLCWLQHGIGHERLRIQINWPGVDRERRGRKTRCVSEPMIREDEFYPIFDGLLAKNSLGCPAPDQGQLVIDELWELGAPNDTAD
ncbi:hypothetical protein [Methylobacterium goesingense]|uniref:Uncharacterized protein n=1 Tax=Methylobacterium goesingense TaxID=243690 RepID=A0ABV2L6N7_9HYPH|nr:hypothetical protein [Methylobacterium goesingense]GJD75135.1 hypothetical protein CFIICLFH_3375 [Methylobacterium goesingense]